MKIQYSNKIEDRIAYIDGLANAPKAENGKGLIPVFGILEINTFYTNRDFMKKAQILSSEESYFLMQISHDFPNCTLVVID